MIILSPYETLRIMQHKFQEERKFSFIRFGDGEINMTKNLRDKDNNHRASKELQNELIEALKIEDEDFMISASATHYTEAGDILSETKAYKGILTGLAKKTADLHQDKLLAHSQKYIYYNVSVFMYHAVYHSEYFVKFVKENIHNKNIVYIGGKSLNQDPLIRFFNVKEYVETPNIDAYYSIDDFYDKILSTTESCELGLISAGLGKIPIQKRLWEEKRFPTLGIGSLANAINGDYNRSWSRAAKENIQNLVKIMNGE